MQETRTQAVDSLRGTRHLRRRHPPRSCQVQGTQRLQTAKQSQRATLLPWLVAQFGSFAPDTACLTSHLCKLLQKETPWLWLPKHKLDCKNTQTTLTSPTMLQPFDPKVKTVVLADAPRLHVIGFALVQVYKDNLALI